MTMEFKLEGLQGLTSAEASELAVALDTKIRNTRPGADPAFELVCGILCRIITENRKKIPDEVLAAIDMTDIEETARDFTGDPNTFRRVLSYVAPRERAEAALELTFPDPKILPLAITQKVGGIIRTLININEIEPGGSF
jgi:hypothetical protein